MLDSMRSAVNSWVAKVFLGLLVICFAVLWGAPQITQITHDDAMSAGSSSISRKDVHYSLNDTMMRYSVALNLPGIMSPDQAQQYQIPQLVLSQLRSDVLLNEEARLMKIGVSKDGIAQALGTDPFLQENGQFSPILFNDYLHRLGVQQNDVFNIYAQKEKRAQLLQGALGGMKAPDAFFAAYMLYQNETRSINYITLKAAQVGSVGEPDKAEQTKWYEAHKESFSVPEYRTITLMSMTGKELVRPADVTPDEIKDFYEKNQARFSEPEKRSYQQLRFATREAADAAAQKLKNGLSFDELIKAEGKKPENIQKGPVTKAELPTLLGGEIFDLQTNQVSTVINDLQGPVIVRLTAMTPSVAKKMSSVEKEIREFIANTNAANAMRDNYQAIEDARFNGEPLKEIASRYQLPLRTITVDSTGKDKNGVQIKDLPESQMLLNAAFQAEADTDHDPLPVQSGGYIWYNVSDITPSRILAESEVQQKVIDGWKNDEIQKKLDKKADELKKELNDGKTIDKLAAQLNVATETARGITRTASPEAIGNDAARAVFAGPDGSIGSAKGANPLTRIIFKVTETVDPLSTSPEDLPQNIRDGFNLSFQDTIQNVMLNFADDAYPIKADPNVLNQILSGQFER